MKPGLHIIYLWCDLATYNSKDDRGAIPWCFSNTRKLFKFPSTSDSYPEKGIKNLPKDCDDYKGIINSDADFAALQQFYAAVENSGMVTMNKAELIKLSRNKDNKYMQGWLLFKRYFDRLYQRSKLRYSVDAALSKLGGMPYQVYHSKRIGDQWPPAKKVSGMHI